MIAIIAYRFNDVTLSLSRAVSLVVSSFALDGRLFWNVPFFPLGGPEAARTATRSFITQGASLVKTYTEISPEELAVVVS